MAEKTKLQQYREQYPEYSDLSDADLAAGIHAKFYADMPEAEFNMRIGFSPAERKSQGRSAADAIGRQLGLTARYGVEGLAGAADIIGAPANAIVNQGIRGLNALGADIPYLSRPSDAVSNAMTQAGFPNPETGLERVVSQPSKFIASLPAFGGVGKLAKAGEGGIKGLGVLADDYLAQAAGAVAGGMGYGVAKELAPDSPAIQIGAALIPGVAGAAGTSALAQRLGSSAEAALPTTAQLRQMGSAAYETADQAGAILRPEAMQRLGQNVSAELAELGYHPQLQPRIAPVLQELERVAQGNITTGGVQALRRIAGNAAMSQDPSERMMGGAIIRQIDELLSTIAPEDVVQGNATEAADALRRGAQLWSQFRKSETIDEAVTKGERRAATSGIGGNEENAIRQNIRAILDNPSRRRGFTADEIEAMEQVVRGGSVQNFLRQVGRFSPTSSTLAGAFGLGTAGTGSPLMALPIAGLLAKPLSEAMARRNVEALSGLIRSGALAVPQGVPAQGSVPAGALGIAPNLQSVGGR